MANQLQFFQATEPVYASFTATIDRIETFADGYQIIYDNGGYDWVTLSEGLAVTAGQSITAGDIISVNDGTINYEKVVPAYGFENFLKSVKGYKLSLTGKLIDYKKLWIKFVDPNFTLYRLQCFINLETPSPYDIIYIAEAQSNDGLQYLENNLSLYNFMHPVDPNNPMVLSEGMEYNDEIAIWIKREIITPAETYLNNKFELGFKLVGFEK